GLCRALFLRNFPSQCTEKSFLVLGADSKADQPWSARNAEMTHGQFFAALPPRTDRQMRPRDCSTPPRSAAGQQRSAGFLPPGQCDSTRVANITGSVFQQEQAPATPTDIEFASSATALRSFNDEIRMSNAFPRNDASTPFAYQPCPGLLTGGKLFRNSFCWRSASFCCSASRVDCSGLGPELAQPSNSISNVEIKIDLVSSFFIREIGTGR